MKLGFYFILDQARKDDLLQPLDTSIIQNLADINADARFKDNMGVGIGYNVVSMYYNTKIFQEKGLAPVASWNDLLRPDLKGRVVIRNITSSSGDKNTSGPRGDLSRHSVR